MARDEQEKNGRQEMQTRILPKNFRQIGDPGSKKIYMEDYVYTYLNKLAQPGNLYARGAILFGKMYQTAIGSCLFISGAAACQNFEFDLEESVFSEEAWTEIYRIRDKFFSELEIVGWFLSRMGFSVELNDKIIRMHMDNFNGENKVLYMIDILENEDAFYQLENYSLKRQRGYYLYYETNKEMKEYMLAEGETENEPELKRKSAAIMRDSSVVKNYKKAMKNKRAVRQKPNWGRIPSKLAGALVMAAVLLYGARSVYEFRNSENAQEVFRQEEAGAAEGDTEIKKETLGTEEKTGLKGESRETEENTETGAEAADTMKADGTTSEDKNGRTQTGGTLEQEGPPKGDSVQTDADVFTQEEPDDIVEAWNYIGGQYTVQQGDTLAGISKKIYQSYDYISMIAEANGIKNIDQIYPGQVLDIPRIED